MVEDMDMGSTPQLPVDDDDEMESTPEVVGQVIQVTNDGGVTKEILQLGSGWEKPGDGDEVKVHYVGTLEQDGSQFDSSRERNEPFSFKLGAGKVIQGWDKGVATMKQGEKALLKCSPLYAYGEEGRPPTIPPNSTLNFEVELLAWHKVNDISKERDNSLIKTTLTEGTGWEKPAERDEILVHYAAYIKGAQEPFDQTPEEGTEFTLQDGLFCRAIGESVKTMKKGERAKLEVKPSYGFGHEGGLGGKVPPDSDLEIELQLMSWKKVEDVTADKLVWKKTIKQGDGYKQPNEGATVTAKFVCRIEGESEIIDERDKFEFITDEEQVKPPIVEEIIMKMKKGETALAHVPPQHGYGPNATGSSGKQIPETANLIFEVTLFNFENAKEQWEMENPEKVIKSGELKEKGNAFFKEQNWKKAAKCYEKAIKLIDYDNQFTTEEQQRAKELRKSTHLNLAACCLRLSDWKEAVKNCDKVLEKESENIKALYRRAQGYLGSKDFVEADLDIKHALNADPNNQDLKNLQKRLKQQEKIQNKKDAKMYGAIFSKMSKSNKDSKPEKNEDVDMADAQNVDQSNKTEPVATT
eukprot:TRINITY_DN2116_c1_g1_i6.p1 TRINITY_DN2116_c1_g1~~TRINITY_DN2116_c1_g1_i6.p1  ORF type:complete len:607 (-),score=149.62 TRINITY_DN2116_c1_g1_i6:671-2416(-)